MSSSPSTAADTKEKPTTSSEPAAASKPVFGSSSTFGTGGGFAGFKGVEQPAAQPEAEEDGAGAGGEDDECAAEFKPLVQLSEVETVSGEEAETALCDFKCKLYRFDKESGSGEWKERGVGQVKLLEHKGNKKIRLLMRQEKTLKIRANHIVMPGTKLQEHVGNEKAWVWSTVDFADESQKMELFCIRFASKERAQQFREQFENAMSQNETLLALDDAEANSKDANPTEVSDLADQVGKVSVADTPNGNGTTSETATPAETTAH
ncbi:hypothetical protein WJX73_008384 [Symbiochloris irregularis]|uniref:RanBD1 domain-containing protein n=1 Tax=Symbiochloris irregularis TaxID=706552 RepID=A0AAW1PQI1_9CHLO